MNFSPSTYVTCILFLLNATSTITMHTRRIATPPSQEQEPLNLYDKALLKQQGFIFTQRILDFARGHDHKLTINHDEEYCNDTDDIQSLTTSTLDDNSHEALLDKLTEIPSGKRSKTSLSSLSNESSASLEIHYSIEQPRKKAKPSRTYTQGQQEMLEALIPIQKLYAKYSKKNKDFFQLVVLDAIEAGLSITTISEASSIPATTISAWRNTRNNTES